MRRLIAFLIPAFLLGGCGSSQAAYLGLYTTTVPGSKIQPSVTISRTSGTGPLYVFFDARGTFDSDSTACPGTNEGSCDTFRDLRYTWSFGDASAPDWTKGTRTGAGSGNVAYGPIAAHVFATAGTYNVTLTVTDGTNTLSNYAAGTITVADPNTTFATTSTICYSGTGTFTNCPSGATQTTQSTWLTSNPVAGTRYLFHCGETFTAAVGVTLQAAGPGYIGAYDCATAAAPVINATANIIFLTFNASGTGASDWRITGLRFSANGNTGVHFTGGNGTTDVSDILLYQNTFDSIPQIFPTDFAVGHVATNVGIVANTINKASGDGVYGYYKNIAILGNYFNDTGTSSVQVNILRLMGPNGWIIGNNEFFHFDNTVAPAASKGVWTTVRCHDVTGSQQAGYGLQSENIAGVSGSSGFAIGNSINTDDPSCVVTENILENNYIYLDGFAGDWSTPVAIDGTHNDIRGNVVNATGIGTSGGNTNVFQSTPSGSFGTPQYLRYFNNTVYNGTTANTEFLYQTNSTSTMLKNNLLYTVNTSGVVFWFGGSNTGTVESNNTCASGAVNSCAGTVGTSPNFTNGSGLLNAITDFKPNTGSYAISAGTSVPYLYDALGIAWSGAYDIGAIKH